MDDLFKTTSLLSFGYVPHIIEGIEDEPWARAQNKVDNIALCSNQKQLIEYGVEELKKSFNECFENKEYENCEHVVPLSGGLDSRAILAELLDRGLRKNIITVTFGTPGTLDYEIGAYVARKARVYHENIDLTKVEVKTDY